MLGDSYILWRRVVNIVIVLHYIFASVIDEIEGALASVDCKMK